MKIVYFSLDFIKFTDNNFDIHRSKDFNINK